MRPEGSSAFVPVIVDGENWGEDGAEDARVVAVLRSYVAVRGTAAPLLPTLIAFAAEQGLGETATVALASVFELTEACLGRTLVAGAGDAMSADEEGVLMLLASVGDLEPHCGSRAVPHGMPGALAWAARSAVRLTGGVCQRQVVRPACPFQP